MHANRRMSYEDDWPNPGPLPNPRWASGISVEGSSESNLETSEATYFAECIHYFGPTHSIFWNTITPLKPGVQQSPCAGIDVHVQSSTHMYKMSNGTVKVTLYCCLKVSQSFSLCHRRSGTKFTSTYSIPLPQSFFRTSLSRHVSGRWAILGFWRSTDRFETKSWT